MVFSDPMEGRHLIEAHAGQRIALIAESFARVTGGALLPGGADPAETLWNLPGVILAHGVQADPMFFYGNRAALTLFEIRADAFIRMPSRLSAEPMEQDERASLLNRVARNNFIPDYSGVRISSTGKRFRIKQAVVWNLLDCAGHVHGQAAWFDRWEPL